MALLSAAKAAKVMKADIEQVKAWMRRAENPLPSVTVGKTGRHRRVVESQIETWLAEEAAREAGREVK